MQVSDFLRFFQMIAQEMLDGDVELAAQYFATPLAIYRKNDVGLRMSRRDIVEALRTRRNRAKAAGTVAIQLDVSKVTQQENGRFVAALCWNFLDCNGDVLDRSIMRYFGTCDPDGSIQVEIAEFQQIAFSDDGLPFFRHRPH